MKSVKWSSILFVSLLGLSLFQVACQRRETLDADDQQNSRVAAFADDSYNDAKSISDEAAKTGSVSGFRIGEASGILTQCATVTFAADSGSFTVDFGAVNCQGNDGRFRRGKILVTTTGRYRDPGTVITITFDQYFVNDHQVLGTKTITNNGLNANSQLTYHVVLVGGQVILPNNGGTFTHDFDRTRTWIAGESTPAWNDDEYEIFGTGSGSKVTGDAWTSSVAMATPLHKMIGCKHPVSGIMVRNVVGKPTRTLDFGNGTCDDQATLTVGNRTRVITLR
jgi:hypothetical protein